MSIGLVVLNRFKDLSNQSSSLHHGQENTDASRQFHIREMQSIIVEVLSVDFYINRKWFRFLFPLFSLPPLLSLSALDESQRQLYRCYIFFPILTYAVFFVSQPIIYTWSSRHTRKSDYFTLHNKANICVVRDDRYACFLLEVKWNCRSVWSFEED